MACKDPSPKLLIAVMTMIIMVITMKKQEEICYNPENEYY
jgi:hypothetical protein